MDTVIGGFVYQIRSDSSALKRDLADVKRIGETLSTSLQSEVNKGTTAASTIIGNFQSKTVAQLSALKGKIDIDTSGLQKQAALLQESIQHKEALAKVQAIGLDVTELEKAEKLLADLSRVNRKVIEIDFKVPDSRDAFNGIANNFKGVLTGISQGIGQQIAMSFTNVLGSALGGIKTILSDRTAFNDFDAAKTSLSSLGADADQLATFAAKATKELKGLASTREILASSYQIVSSGFQGQDAIDIATIAKKTAVATPETSGKTADTGIVGDAMTTVLKSYKLDASEAVNVSQQMIGVVNAGKIEMGQYASLIGNVSSNAYAAGISLNDLNAVIAAATQNGVKAEATMSGMNAAASAIAKPSSEALAYAQKLGIDFSLAGVKAAGGFVPFLQKLKDVGASDFSSVVRLFGSVEAAKALNPVLSSLGAGFYQMSSIRSCRVSDVGK
ncbi:MAG: phage tail tape measure protein [Stenomitos frigidus ULC029]